MARIDANAVKAKAQAAGIPWDLVMQYLLSLNWMEIVATLREFWSAWRRGPRPSIQSGPALSHEDKLQCVADHQDLIIDIATCCKEHCTAT